MSSGRLNENNEPIIDKKNITRETKINKEHKQKKNWTSFDHYSDCVTKFWQINFKVDRTKWHTDST
jgi:hypothetical protein